MVKFLNYLALLVVCVEAGLSSLAKIPLSSKQNTWADIFFFELRKLLFFFLGYLYSAFDLQIRSISKYPFYLIMNPGVDALNSKQRSVISTRVFQVEESVFFV